MVFTSFTFFSVASTRVSHTLSTGDVRHPSHHWRDGVHLLHPLPRRRYFCAHHRRGYCLGGSDAGGADGARRCARQVQKPSLPDRAHPASSFSTGEKALLPCKAHTAPLGWRKPPPATFPFLQSEEAVCEVQRSRRDAEKSVCLDHSESGHTPPDPIPRLHLTPPLLTPARPQHPTAHPPHSSPVHPTLSQPLPALPSPSKPLPAQPNPSLPHSAAAASMSHFASFTLSHPILVPSAIPSYPILSHPSPQCYPILSYPSPHCIPNASSRVRGWNIPLAWRWWFGKGVMSQLWRRGYECAVGQGGVGYGRIRWGGARWSADMWCCRQSY